MSTLESLSIRSAGRAPAIPYQLGFFAPNLGEGNLVLRQICEHPLADVSSGFGGNRLIVYVLIRPWQVPDFVAGPPWATVRIHGPNVSSGSCGRI
jgi:hypothetical protein